MSIRRFKICPTEMILETYIAISAMQKSADAEVFGAGLCMHACMHGCRPLSGVCMVVLPRASVPKLLYAVDGARVESELGGIDGIELAGRKKVAAAAGAATVRLGQRCFSICRYRPSIVYTEAGGNDRGSRSPRSRV
jgi:hypothetical protein